MGSVVVSWSGSCNAPDRRLRLATRLAELGRLSHSYFPQAPDLTDFTAGSHRGRILIDGRVFAPDQDVTDCHIAHRGRPSSPPSLALPLGLQPEAPDPDDDLYAFSEVTLEGVEFSLYDGRFLHQDNRISFLCACFPERPDLGYRLVKPFDRTECLATDNPVLQSADLYLARPNIRLRYYCEDWMDWLLAAVKMFFVQDLDYWHHRPMGKFDAIATQTQELTPETAENVVFAHLEQRLSQEVEAWRETAREIDSFWSLMRKSAGEAEPEPA